MRLPYLPKYSLVLLLLLSCAFCKKRDRYLNDPDNMTDISNIEEVYSTGVPQKIRRIGQDLAPFSN